MVEQAAAPGFSSGRIYDALLLRYTGKVSAEAIYTWNLRHFRAIDPEQAAKKIRTP